MMPVQYWFYIALAAGLLGWAAAIGLRSPERLHRRLACARMQCDLAHRHADVWKAITSQPYPRRSR